MRLSVWLIGRPRWFKRALLVTNDLLLLSLAVWLAYSLRLSRLYVPETLGQWGLLAAAPVIGVAVFYYRGLYKLVTRFIGPEGTSRIYVAVLIATVGWAVLILMSDMRDYPRSVVVIYGLIAAGFIRLSRQWAGSILLNSVPGQKPLSFDKRKPVIIYGAGPTGLQLLSSLTRSGQHRTVALVDNDPTLHGQVVHGLKVHRPEKLGKLIEQNNVKEVLLAMPSALRSERRSAIEALEPYPVQVKTLPALEEIASGKVEVSDLRPIEVDDLLGRDPVAIDIEQLSAHVRDKTVMITGAGGSIGSELSRQLLQLGPKRLVLFELSEVALYEIGAEIEQMQRREAKRLEGQSASIDAEIVGVLGSVLDRKLVASTIETYGVDAIYHAAAYKHVPIVEENPFVGIQNNTFGTLTLADAARESNIERFVLVSSDKAVRPTNVMGASKRLAELVLQGLASEPDTRTIFTMVRFGNVLDSSGSVVRRFRNQIRDGGPVTVTHPDIIRYFMLIPEAAQLVIQAGAMSTGGEVFVLDMGTPVRIADLARTMVRLSGLEVRDSQNPNGDIAVEYVGLRRGEKLYEELLIGENTAATTHPRIFRNSEPYMPYADLAVVLERLAEAVDSHDHAELQAILSQAVEGYAAEGSAAQLAAASNWQPVSTTVH
jgi:FlaA1/EpsC-like NDP-sugar epimerase